MLFPQFDVHNIVPNAIMVLLSTDRSKMVDTMAFIVNNLSVRFGGITTSIDYITLMNMLEDRKNGSASLPFEAPVLLADVIISPTYIDMLREIFYNVKAYNITSVLAGVAGDISTTPLFGMSDYIFVFKEQGTERSVLYDKFFPFLHRDEFDNLLDTLNETQCIVLDQHSRKVFVLSTNA